MVRETESAHLAQDARSHSVVDAFGHFLSDSLARHGSSWLRARAPEVAQEARIRLARALEADASACNASAAVHKAAAMAAIDAVRRVKLRREDGGAGDGLPHRPRETANCPGSEVLALSAQGALPAGDSTAVVSHVERCADCAEELGLVNAARAWSDTVAPAPTAAVARAASAAGAPQAARRWRSARAVAFLLAALAVALAVWVFELQRRNLRLAAEVRTAREAPSPALATRARTPADQRPVPQLGVPLLRLQPTAPGSPPTELAPGVGVTLQLEPSAALGRDYRLRILAHDGNIVWEGTGALPQGQPLTVGLPPGLVQPGEYRLELFEGAEKGQSRGVYRVKVTG